MIGIVIRENSVLVSRHFDAYTGSDPYFSARSAVVLPAGIAVRITAHPVMIGSAFNRRMIKSARNGSATRRINARYTVLQSLKDASVSSVIIVPIRTMESGVVQFPSPVIDFARNSGRVKSVKLLKSPIKITITHGFSMTFLNAAFLSASAVKIDTPAVHIKIRFGIIKIDAKNIPASPSTAFTIGSPKNAALFSSVTESKANYITFGYMS